MVLTVKHVVELEDFLLLAFLGIHDLFVVGSDEQVSYRDFHQIYLLPSCPLFVVQKSSIESFREEFLI